MTLRSVRHLATVLIGLVVAAPIAGCGRADVGATSTTALSASDRVSDPAGRSDCERAGLFGPRLPTQRDAHGVCRASNGQLVQLVAFGHPARLRDLTFAVNGARTAARLSEGVVEAAARGTFVVVSVTLTNTSGTVQRVRDEQFRLEMDRRIYPADHDAAIGADQASLEWRTLRGLPPGATVTGDVVFDVPRRLAARVIAAGFIVGFSYATVTAGHPLPDHVVGASPLAE